MSIKSALVDLLMPPRAHRKLFKSRPLPTGAVLALALVVLCNPLAYPKVYSVLGLLGETVLRRMHLQVAACSLALAHLKGALSLAEVS